MQINKFARLIKSLFFLTALMVFPISGVHGQATQKSPDYRELNLFRQVMQLVQKNYVKDVADKALVQGAIDGMLQSLDPNSSFLDPEQFKELQADTGKEFAGIGIEITLENGILTVVSPIDDTPAFKAGLKPGDKIIKINGDLTKSISLLKAVKEMRGPQGSKVKLTVMREGFRSSKDFTMTREVIKVHSVIKELLEPGYPYIKITAFTDNTDSQIEAAIKEFGEDRIKGVVLDLRNNPSGLLDNAVKFSQLFLDKGVIVSSDGRIKKDHTEYKATPDGKHYQFKIAVLINDGTAAASEIVAGALQDNDRAVVFGTKSFGKASLQEVIPLENGAGLRLTTAYYNTPKGKQIQKTGIQPDLDMKQEVTKQAEAEAEHEKSDKGKQEKPKPQMTKPNIENDPVAKKALEWLKSDLTAKQFKDENPPKPAADTALNAAEDEK